MSPKKRSKDKHLPPNVYFKHKAYYYVIEDLITKKRKWNFLSKNFGEAMTKWAKLVNKNSKIYTMNQLFDRYMIEVAPQKAPKSYTNHKYQMIGLRLFFGSMAIEDVLPITVYEYLDMRGSGAKGKVAANREKSLLSHCFTMAIRWGLVNENPCKNVKRNPESPRKRYIEDWEFNAVYNLAPDLIKCIMRFAYLTGQRIGDILKLKLSDITPDGIKIEQGKSNAKTRIIIQWTDELTKCVDKSKRLFRPIRGLHLFCNNRGRQYTGDGFSSMWQRLINKAIEDGVIKERFTFHDIRAKTRSDADSGINASELLGHSDPRITERVYNRKHKKVSPIR